jgi:hypothetical protein
VTERIEIGEGIVSRPAYPWTSTIHSLLRFLPTNGFDRVPVPIGIEGGRETVTMIHGDSGADGWRYVVPEDGLRSFARFLRAYHDATRDFRPSEPCRWAFRDGSPGPGEVVCHGDFGPWNVVWREERPVGLLDFDFAEPGDPMLDVVYALDYVAPFCDDEEATRWRAYGRAPDRRERIATFLDAYGAPDLTGVVDSVIARRELDIEHVRSLAERDIDPQRTWAEDGMLDELAERFRWLREHRPIFDKVVRRCEPRRLTREGALGASRFDRGRGSHRCPRCVRRSGA